MASSFFATIGVFILQFCDAFGRYAIFVYQMTATLFATKFKTDKLLLQMERIGVQSLPISVLTGFCTGAVLALQTYTGFKQFGSQAMIGPVVALTMTRELGPVLTSLMVTGRCGSGIAAELGSMRITEQIDALETLGINSFQYLLVPRVIATIIMVPLLAIFSMLSGIFGGYLVCVHVYGLNPIDYVTGVKLFLVATDIVGGIIKAAVFGFILSSVGGMQGFYTQGGAKGVGLATTQSVVIASIAILISDYFLTQLLF